MRTNNGMNDARVRNGALHPRFAKPFKKCFHDKCFMIFVPQDFRPSSPRRVFCSVECFDTHWRELLLRFFGGETFDGHKAFDGSDR